MPRSLLSGCLSSEAVENTDASTRVMLVLPLSTCPSTPTLMLSVREVSMAKEGNQRLPMSNVDTRSCWHQKLRKAILKKVVLSQSGFLHNNRVAHGN
jgi:hypothetical protein